jgi:hypothetical protein
LDAIETGTVVDTKLLTSVSCADIIAEDEGEVLEDAVNASSSSSIRDCDVLLNEAQLRLDGFIGITLIEDFCNHDVIWKCACKLFANALGSSCQSRRITRKVIE